MKLKIDPVTISVDERFDETDTRCGNIQIQGGSAYELNLMVQIADFGRLEEVKTAPFKSMVNRGMGGSVRIRDISEPLLEEFLTGRWSCRD